MLAKNFITGTSYSEYFVYQIITNHKSGCEEKHSENVSNVFYERKIIWLNYSEELKVSIFSLILVQKVFDSYFSNELNYLLFIYTLKFTN